MEYIWLFLFTNILQFLSDVIKSIIPLFINIAVVKNSKWVKEIDIILTEKYTIKGRVERNLGKNYPGEGWHIHLVRGLILHKKKISQDHSHYNEYDIYYWKDTILKELEKESIDKIRVAYHVALNPWQCYSTIDYIDIPGSITKEQKKSVDSIVKVYNEKKRVTCLVHGLPGSGKSSLGYFIAYHLNKQSSIIETSVLEGWGPKQKGISLQKALKNFDPSSAQLPIIIVVNDIDKSVLFAEENKESKDENSCVAQDKTSLSNTMDYISRNEGLIVLYTMNEDDTFIEKYNSYFRKGRIDVKLKMNTLINKEHED